MGYMVFKVSNTSFALKLLIITIVAFLILLKIFPTTMILYLDRSLFMEKRFGNLNNILTLHLFLGLKSL